MQYDVVYRRCAEIGTHIESLVEVAKEVKGMERGFAEELDLNRKFWKDLDRQLFEVSLNLKELRAALHRFIDNDS